METYRSNGKLLITGEYVVLDGAMALAVPTVYGQSLIVEPTDTPILNWKSIDNLGNIWFEDSFNYNELTKLPESIAGTSNRLKQIIYEAKQLNPEFLNSKKGFKVTTTLDFPNNWGLGSSSTLINNVAQWANVDAYTLLEATFGGSGYDIACAQYHTPITYQLLNSNSDIMKLEQEEKRLVNAVNFNPSFKNNLFFVYLNKKQNSRDGIAHYKKKRAKITPVISEINTITSQIIACDNLLEFQRLIEVHETLISEVTEQPTIKSILFNDFKGAMKSLGAWGGDFILVCSETNPTAYFNSKGFNTVIPYDNMVKQ